ncbi:hypothetical protein, conserved [Entamoeba dispar SAW760]|uniref:Uncharacterized protein n=1 Tax=Entamoeba dispar (strain ATCC PRA-260 / SAW760) TaxID=370354 RepID=B0E6Q3_ENTDS|nr:uncharacterized protein EDI_061620 [Entamoeba dispar SAW760]EDR29807.1 hypothetical protein, conserved [Entamoeba dispar SAW760]|eukprot:EDR29807.1 hypothetical protein, conserved [Entamoeba dispar SAW760]
MTQKYSFKICVIGNEKIGKTSLVRRFLEDKFIEESTPFEDVSVSKKVIYNNKEVILNFMDPLGTDVSTTATFYNDANLLIALFDETEKDSIQNCKNWLSYGDRYIGSQYLKLIVGNKLDSNDKKVTEEECEEVAKSLNCEYFEVSAKTGEGIKELYEHIMKMLFEPLNPKEDSKKSSNKKSGKKQSEKNGEKKKGGCVLL